MTQQEIDEAITKLNKKVFGNNDSIWKEESSVDDVDEKIKEVSEKILIAFYNHSKKVSPLLTKHVNTKVITNLPVLSEEKLVELYEISDGVVNCCLEFLNKTDDDVKFLDNYYGKHKVEFYKNKNNEKIYDRINECVEHAKYGLDLYGCFRGCYQLETVIRFGKKITKEQIKRRIIEVKNLVKESSYFDDEFKKDSNNILNGLSKRNKEREKTTFNLRGLQAQTQISLPNACAILLLHWLLYKKRC